MLSSGGARARGPLVKQYTNRLGFYLGAGAQSWNDRGPDAVHDADQRTARDLGNRVAKLGQLAI